MKKSGSKARDLFRRYYSRVSTCLIECIHRGKSDGSIRKIPEENTALILQGLMHGVSRLTIHGPDILPDLSSEVINFCLRSLAMPNLNEINDL